MCACCVSARCACSQGRLKYEERQEGRGGGCRRGERHRLWYYSRHQCTFKHVKFLQILHVSCRWNDRACFFHLTASAKKAKKTKEPEAPILYEDPPDKLTSKDGRKANMKITSWNVDGLRAWVKKNGLDVSIQRPWENLSSSVFRLVSVVNASVLPSSGCVRRIQMFCACRRRSVQRNPSLLKSPRCPSTLTSTGLGQMKRRVTVGWPCSARLNLSKSPMALVSDVLTFIYNSEYTSQD